MSKRSVPSVQLYGGAGTVTGSKHLLRAGDHRVLLDCGMFQGPKDLRLRNWNPFPFEPASLDAVVLSHAHIDHTGLLPKLVREGFGGPIYATPATADLLGILLPDAAYLQEEQAAHANRFGYSKHKPALPLYTMEDAVAALSLVEGRPYRTPFEPCPGVQVTYRVAGHILGSATVDIELERARWRRLVFSGDLGRWDQPIIKDPAPVPEADLLLLESTYGSRVHAPDPVSQLADVVRRCADRGGTLLIPAFAVGRTQELIWYLRELETEGAIPSIPVYVDSPMAVDVTRLYARHTEEHDLETNQLLDQGRHPLRTGQYKMVRTVDGSKALNSLRGPFIIISASGMATGGRILHHLKRWLPDQRTTVLLVGYQVPGTRGHQLIQGARSVRIHGAEVAVRATIEQIDGLSAHADQSELLRWLEGFERHPRLTVLVHGEPSSSAELASIIEARKSWKARVSEQEDLIEL